jgi:hypothetical protein
MLNEINFVQQLIQHVYSFLNELLKRVSEHYVQKPFLL